MRQRRVVTKKEALAYRGASQAGKTWILDELVELTGWHRDYARTELFRHAGVEGPQAPERSHPTWAAGGGQVGEVLGRVVRPLGTRLAPMMRRDGGFDLTDAEAGLLMGLSAARLIASWRRNGTRCFPMTARIRSHARY